MGPYAHALALGTDLGADEKQQVAEKLHEYTGLPVAYLLKANLRVSGGEFEKTLQDDNGHDDGAAGYALLRAEPRSAERERGVRPAKLGDFFGIRVAVQRLRAARSEIRRGADLSARGAFREHAMGLQAQRQPR